jgi:hypothetical protein
MQLKSNRGESMFGDPIRVSELEASHFHIKIDQGNCCTRFLPLDWYKMMKRNCLVVLITQEV